MILYQLRGGEGGRVRLTQLSGGGQFTFPLRGGPLAILLRGFESLHFTPWRKEPSEGQSICCSFAVTVTL